MRRTAIVAALALVAVALGGVLVATFASAGEAGWSALGSLDGYPAHTVTHVPEHGVFLVRFEDGDAAAFVDRDPRNGCPLRWVSADEIRAGALPEDYLEASPLGVFCDPCHGSTYAFDGTRVFGPSPRDLDRYALRVEGGAIEIDTSEVFEGTSRVTPRPPGATPTPVPRDQLPGGTPGGTPTERARE